MEVIGSIFDWIGNNESVLSGIAAGIVILGVAYGSIRRLLPQRAAATPPVISPTGPATANTGPPVPELVRDRPSIAVVPFANLSLDPEQEFLADGLTEDIILGLSRVRQLFVIARNSCFTYKGRTVDASQVSHELGVRYVLEGSVRRSGERIRVTAQLVDATHRNTLWSEHFDRNVEQITEVDDEVTEAILTALLPALRRAEAEQARRSAPEDLTTWALVNRAWVSVQSDLGDQAALRDAVVACREALGRDPDNAFALAVLGLALSLDFSHADASPEPQPEGAEEAREAMRRALDLDPDDPLVQHCNAALQGNIGRTEDAVRAWKHTIELDPNSAGARAGLGIAQVFMRETESALGNIDAALRRSPRDTIAYHWLGHRAMCLMLLDRPSEAAEAARTSVARRPSRMALAVLACALSECDDEAGAVDAWKALEQRMPRLDPEAVARMAGGLAPDPTRGAEIERRLIAVSKAAAESTVRVQ